ncbi:winged helix-turn-helix domain-containing protein [Shewanella sp. NIFS-20-20]|uniref:winged helix-turn-helix domain-containing protein n=1 Tax=Shewanella sp. NIFS-20-20 TaxID=2853806 RepID=UPI001C448648|nr:winged helix-turn-helix domain-containing protein [Shewanella sp. NIFS-20-20]MBV7314940.1 winged helix-turn-helix domain-containing protein [Shewanella sp. NIFS-20-20]
MATILIFQALSSATHLPRQCLEQLGYGVLVVRSQEQFWQELSGQMPDLIVFDTHAMPVDNIRIIRDIRSQSVTPILVLSPQSDVFDIVIALEMGADDFMTAPWVLRELQVRMRNLIWRHELLKKARHQLQQISCQGNDLYFDEYHLSISKRQLRQNEQPIALTKAEFELLQAFIRHPQQVLSRQRLMQQTHHRHLYVNERTIDVIIRRLRQKLSAALFVTIHGEGYLFAATPSPQKNAAVAA